MKVAIRCDDYRSSVASQKIGRYLFSVLGWHDRHHCIDLAQNKRKTKKETKNNTSNNDDTIMTNVMHSANDSDQRMKNVNNSEKKALVECTIVHCLYFIAQ